MKITTFIFSMLLLSTGFLSANRQAAEPVETEFLQELKSIREQYTAKKDELMKINQKHEEKEKNEGSIPKQQRLVNSQKRAEKWYPIFRETNELYEKYLFKLVDVFVKLSETDPKTKEIKEEILNQHPNKTKKNLTEAYGQQLSLLANASHPHLSVHGIKKEKAAFIAKLLKPKGSTRFEDIMHLIGITTEAQNWNIQADYSLAHLRAGNIAIARKENAKLLRKSERLSQKRSSLNYSKENHIRSCLSLHREFLLHRALIEALANQSEQAHHYLRKALKIKEGNQVQKEQESLVDEIKMLIE
jgi:hypothetical protein